MDHDVGNPPALIDPAQPPVDVERGAGDQGKEDTGFPVGQREIVIERDMQKFRKRTLIADG